MNCFRGSTASPMSVVKIVSASTVSSRATFNIVRFAGMGWSSYECLRYSAMLQRRVKLGLAEPMVAHRIWLWGVGACAQTLVIGFDMACRFWTGIQLADTAAGLSVLSLFGLVGVVALACAFFPPAAYVRLVTRGTSTPADAEVG